MVFMERQQEADAAKEVHDATTDPFRRWASGVAAGGMASDVKGPGTVGQNVRSILT